MPRLTMRNPVPAPEANAPVIQVHPSRPAASGALRREEAAAWCGVSASTWDDWRRAGVAPDPLPILKDRKGRARIVQWAVSHLELWLMHGRPDRARFRAILDAARRAAR